MAHGGNFKHLWMHYSLSNGQRQPHLAILYSSTLNPQAKVEYEKELSLDVLYKKHPIGYIIADFYIPKQTNFGISEDIIIETKQATLEEKAEYLSQLKIYLKSRAKHLGKEQISKAMLIQWDKKDDLAEDHNSITFTADIKIDVWELQRDKLHKIWSSDKKWLNALLNPSMSST